MSVINQMLKDLDKRDNEQKNAHYSAMPEREAGSSFKTIAIIIAVFILINLIGLVGWHLYSENKALKLRYENETAAYQTTDKRMLEKKQREPLINTPNLDKQQQITQLPLALEQTGMQAEQSSLKESKTDSPSSISSALNDDAEYIEKPKKLPDVETFIPAKTYAKAVKLPQQQNKSAQAGAALFVDEPNEADIAITPKKASSFSVTRRQLSTTELIQQKMQTAEKYISSNRISEAEKIYEDILFLQPEHKQARKKLAALWFGRQAYQPAINLLSQGIVIDPKDSDFRLMKARIFLLNKKAQAALDVLKGFSDSTDIQYQSLMANIAQQNLDYTTAINAYARLIALQPQQSRWWLGSAIAYDSEQQYDKAIESYKSALALGDLSTSSTDFVQQRILELGE